MVNLSYILFICIVSPMALMLGFVDKKARRTIIFMLIGMFVCMVVSELNALLRDFISYNTIYITTSVTPISEEVIKAIPIIFFALMLSDDREEIISIAFSVGVGFAILENLIIFTQSISNVDYIWALLRGFSSGLMHSICTALIGTGLVAVKKKRKLRYCGTFALLNVAIVYHAIFNSLVQAQQLYLNVVGFLMPMLTYVSLIFLRIKLQKIYHIKLF